MLSSGEGGVLEAGFDFSGMKSYYKNMKSTISERGQVTIPKKIREFLGLRPGQELEFEAKQGLLIARKKTSGKDPVAEVTGILPAANVDQSLERSRGPKWMKELDENSR